MIDAEVLMNVPLFAGLCEEECRRLTLKAADILVDTGEWVIRETEDPRFFVVLEGVLQAVKDIVGQRRELDRIDAGDFFGELPILLGCGNLVSVYALSRCRLARFDRQQLQELIQVPSCGERVFERLKHRLLAVPQYVNDTPSARVQLAGSVHDPGLQEICRFLSANRIQYDMAGNDAERQIADSCATGRHMEVAALIDRTTRLQSPNVRDIAEALGFRTAPKQERYDLVIIGAGPAGMAAGVYSASEGLNVLMIERSAAGGQAGTSSRIENYLGFPSGISGDELTERALKQANRFGSELVVTRTVEEIASSSDSYHLRLDGGEMVGTKTVLLCTGADWHQADIPGLQPLLGRGVLYGASRNEAHGVLGKRVFIVGGGNSAGQAAVFFSSYAAEVIMLIRGTGLASSMSRYLIDQIAKRSNIHIEALTEITLVEGEGHLESITTSTRAADGRPISATRVADALFLMIGAAANTSWLPPAIERDPKGYVCTGRDLTNWTLDREPFALETSLPGIFCAGDARHGSIKRVASGVGEGSMSIAFIHQYLALAGNPDLT